MKASRKTASGTLLTVLCVAGAVLGVAAWNGTDGSAGARSAGPVPGLPEAESQASPAPGDYRGVHSLPPVGTSPSTPVQGELLIRLVARPGTGFPGRFVPVHQVWVYSDGRAVWRREGGPNGDTGFLEQRLAPPGVELLQSEYLSTGLFDRHGYFLSEQGLSWGEMEARDGARLATVAWCCPPLNPVLDPGPNPQQDPTAQQTSALIRLSDGLADLSSWLPTSAWEDREPKAYVPSRYAICYRRGYEPGLNIGLLGTDESLEPSRILRELPAAAKDLLSGKDRTYDFPDSSLGSYDHAACSEVTTEDARALEKILRSAGAKRTPYPALVETYSAPAPDPIGTLFISFEPILPHGTWEAMGG